MIDGNGTAIPGAPPQAAWVRDRSIKVVEELTRLVELIRELDTSVSDEIQSSLHFPVSAALANAIRVAAFTAGRLLSADDVSALVGSVYRGGPAGYDEILDRLTSHEDPVAKLEPH